MVSIWREEKIREEKEGKGKWLLGFWGFWGLELGMGWWEVGGGGGGDFELKV